MSARAPSSGARDAAPMNAPLFCHRANPRLKYLAERCGVWVGTAHAFRSFERVVFSVVRRIAVSAPARLLARGLVLRGHPQRPFAAVVSIIIVRAFIRYIRSTTESTENTERAQRNRLGCCTERASLLISRKVPDAQSIVCNPSSIFCPKLQNAAHQHSSPDPLCPLCVLCGFPDPRRRRPRTFGSTRRYGRGDVLAGFAGVVGESPHPSSGLLVEQCRDRSLV